MRQQQNVPLAGLTTLRLGGPAARLLEMESVDELVETVRELDARREPLLVLGGGSNLVVADEGFAGTVLKLAFADIEFDAPPPDGLAGGARALDGRRFVSAEAGADWDSLVARAVDLGYRGIECLSGIPGSVGATPMQNVGAYGQEVSETIERVRLLDRTTGELIWIDNEHCDFAYRSSRFRGHARYIVVQVVFGFAPGGESAEIRYAELARALGVREGERAPVREVRGAVLRLRGAKGMRLDPLDPESVSAGSFFVNPVVDAAKLTRVSEIEKNDPVPRFPMADGRYKVPAAWLIEHAGFTKGHRRGHVSISNKHALALVHRGGGTTRELLDLAREVRDAVRARFGIELAAEPVMVGCSL